MIGVGRVKTPTLAIACKRELEIRDFVPVPYFEVVAAAQVEGGTFRMRHAPKARILKREKAQAVMEAARDFEGPLGVRVEDKRQRPPRLHDLPSLQKLCSARFGWPASKTLEVAQELYDGAGKKILTYPRAEVRYLPESAISDVPKIVAGLQAGKAYGAISVPSPPAIRKGRNGSFHDKGLEGASHHAVIPNVNTIGDLREIWPRLSGDEKKLFDAVARSYLASVMPDYRYRQTTVTLDVGGFEFRATGRQPIESGWRDAFPDWRPAEEKGEAAQALPSLRDKEAARLRDPEIEDKETRPPPRYKEGTLIEAMQNAWRFVKDEALRDRLKEAKGIGTPATRAEIIAGLKKQGFLTTREKNIVPTEQGLALFGVLERADPALVDPGVTAEMECLLDDVVLGRQEMMGAIDAVCDAARRIIGKLGDGAAAGERVELGDASGGGDGKDRPPTAAMKRFAASIAKRKGIKPPAGYTKSAAVCRAFLDLHAPERSAPSAESAGAAGTRLPSPAQVSFAEAIARDKDVTVPDEARACSAAMSKWIDANRRTKPAKGRKAPARNGRAPAAKGKTAQAKNAAWAEFGKHGQGSGPIRRGPDGSGSAHAAPDSLRQQGDRDCARRPIRGARLVCAARCRPHRIPRAWMAVRPRRTRPCCGPREGRSCGLRTGDEHSTNRSLSLKDASTPFSLRALLPTRLPANWVFTEASTGEPLTKNALYHFWLKARDEAGIVADARLHDLRHSFASQAAMQDIPLPVVARLLGHAQVQMTLRYAHVSDRGRRGRR